MSFPSGNAVPTIPVPNVELTEGLSEGANERGPWAVKRYLVNWNDRFTFVQAMAGGSTRSGGSGTGGAWIRIAPYPYPANPIMYAREVSIEPAGRFLTPSAPIAFEYAIVTVTFGPLSWDALPSDDPFFLNSLGINAGEQGALQYASQELSYGYEIYELPNSALTFAADGAPAPGNYGVRIPVVTISITWHRFPVMPFGIIQQYVGKVNNDTFLGCAEGTVFLDGCETSREQSFSDGTGSGAYGSNVTQQVRMVFRWRPIDWNRFLRPSTLQWEFVIKPGPEFIYEAADFDDLLGLFS